MIFAAMLALGWLIGLVGAGGAGLTISVLTVSFGVPIHTALAVALASMAFTMLSGAYSHFREGDVIVRIGLVTGTCGIIGSAIGVRCAQYIPPSLLSAATGGMLLLSTVLLYFQLFRSELLRSFVERNASSAEGSHFYIVASAIGLGNGFLSGAFGIGASAFIQICLMLFFGVSLYHAIGTTMMIILPISVTGGVSYLLYGQLDPYIFVQTLGGLVIGSFVGAKFTRMIPKNILRYIVVSLPTTAGLMLILR